MSAWSVPARAFMAGSLVVYFWDPERGRRRRARAAQKLERAAHDFSRLLEVGGRDLRQRGVGALYEARYRAVGGRDVDDDVLKSRVKAVLGHQAARPRALEVAVDGGVVTLRGTAAAAETRALVRTVRRVPGVRRVEAELDADASDARRRGGGPLGVFRERWSPTARLVYGGAGLLLASLAPRRGSLAKATLAGAGLLLLGRSTANAPVRRLLGLGGGRGGIGFARTLRLRVPPDKAFDFFSDFTNFPLFMRHIRQVRELGAGRSFWRARGPAGADVTWTAVVTRVEPDRLIAWKSDQDSALGHAGLLRFEPTGQNETRLTVRMSYRPPAGVLGHTVAALLGANPKKELDEDLARAKTYLETGRPARDAAQPRTVASGMQKTFLPGVH